MSRYYAPFRGAARGDGGGCLPLPIIAAEAALAVVDAAIAATAFVQLARIHRHNQQHGWTRQKFINTVITTDFLSVNHFAVFLAYFVSTVIATCEKWLVRRYCFLPRFYYCCHSGELSILYWCLTNDEDEDDVRSHQEALLDRTKTKPGTRPTDARRKCFPGIQLGSRQKFVILVLVLSFIVMLAFAILIWVGRGENPIDSSLLKKVYLDVFSVVVLVLGAALACYGALLFSKMSKVRSETVSTEKWKVASLAAVSLICFSSSAILALVTNIPDEYHLIFFSSPLPVRELTLEVSDRKKACYYGGRCRLSSSVPSGFVLWVMRDMPQRPTVERPTQSRVVTLFRDRPSPTQDPQWRAAVTSSNKELDLKHFWNCRPSSQAQFNLKRKTSKLVSSVLETEIEHQKGFFFPARYLPLCCDVISLEISNDGSPLEESVSVCLDASVQCCNAGSRCD
uniref:Uncharacterized protein n=1 Tax=Aegilops tauschii TaxID=37682 RepID=M8BAH7_AEGTA